MPVSGVYPGASDKDRGRRGRGGGYGCIERWRPRQAASGAGELVFRERDGGPRLLPKQM